MDIICTLGSKPSGNRTRRLREWLSEMPKKDPVFWSDHE
jgi:hypothetical protein